MKCSEFLQNQSIYNRENRIKYYLGPLYNIKHIEPDNFSRLSNFKFYNDWELRYKKDIADLLTKYDYSNYKLNILFGDITYPVDKYYLVRNRWTPKDKGIILFSLAYDHSWYKFYNNKDTIDFNNKLSKVFWRGSTTISLWNIKWYRYGNREQLIHKWFDKHPDIDIGFSEIVENQNKYSKFLKNYTSPKEFYKYKYLLSVEGHAEAGGLNWKLASNSVVLMPKPNAITWLMEDKLIPNYHYVQIMDNFDNLEDKLYWCNSNPAKVKHIIKNANNYMKMFENYEDQKNIEKEVLRLYFKKTN